MALYAAVSLVCRPIRVLVGGGIDASQDVYISSTHQLGIPTPLRQPYRHVLIDKNSDKEYGLVGCGASSVRIYTSEPVITMQ